MRSKAALTLPIAFLLYCVACDESAPPKVPGPLETNAPPAGMHAGSGGQKSAAITIEPRQAGTRHFPYAVIEGRIGDKPAKLVIDTGSPTHAIDKALGADANAKITLEGWGELAPRPVELIDLPPNVRQRGVAGIISPQALVEQGQAVVVDFVNKQLRLRPKSMAWSEVKDVGAMMGPVRACAADSNGAQGQLLVLDGTIDGAPARIGLDTGTNRTIVIEGSAGGGKVAAHPPLGRSVGHGVRGQVAAALQGGVPLATGAWSTTIDVGLAPGTAHPQCGHEARFGVDVLSYCAIAIAADETAVACRALGQ